MNWAMMFMRGNTFVENWAELVQDTLDKAADPDAAVSGPAQQSPYYVADWNTFLTKVKSVFGDKNKAATARNELQALKMSKDETVRSFYHRFQDVATKSVSSQEDLFLQFKTKVPFGLAIKMASHHPEPDNLADWVDKAEGIKQSVRQAVISAMSQRRTDSSPSFLSPSARPPAPRVQFAPGPSTGPRLSFSSQQPPALQSTYRPQAPSYSSGPPSISQALRPPAPRPQPPPSLVAWIKTAKCHACGNIGHLRRSCPNVPAEKRNTYNVHSMTVQEIEEQFAEMDQLQQQAYDEATQLYNIQEDPPSTIDTPNDDYSHQQPDASNWADFLRWNE